MPNLNKVMLMGNLTRNIEIKYTPKGTAIGQFGLAINRVWTSENGDKHEEATFIDVDAFGKSAETISQYTQKGDPLYVEGRLKLETWDDKQTGQKRSKMKVVLEGFQLLGKARAANTTATDPVDKATPPREPSPNAKGNPDYNPDIPPDDIPF